MAEALRAVKEYPIDEIDASASVYQAGIAATCENGKSAFDAARNAASDAAWAVAKRSPDLIPGFEAERNWQEEERRRIFGQKDAE